MDIRRQIDLIESMQYGVLLTESARMDFLAKTYGAKIASRWHQEQDQGLDDDITNAIYGEQGLNNLADAGDLAGFTPIERIISYIASHDPTRNHKYTQWMVMRWTQGRMRLEDLPMVMDDLEVFDRAKARLEKRDINLYQNRAELADAVAPFRDPEAPVSSRDEQRRINNRMHQEDHAQVLLDDAEYKIVVPLTHEASKHFGVNTQWCTAMRNDSSHFDRYTRQGPLYIILHKPTNTRWQFHFESRQFGDKNDHMIDLREFLQEHPRIFKFFPRKKWIGVIDKIGPDFFTPDDFKSMTPEEAGLMVARLPADREKTMRLFDPERINTYDFVAAALTGINSNAAELVAMLVNAVDKEHLIRACGRHPQLLELLPEDYQTNEAKMLGATELLARTKLAPQDSIDRLLAQFNRYISEPWPPTVKRDYWEIFSKSSSGRIADIPEEYRTPELIQNVLVWNPSEMTHHGDLVTPYIARLAVERNNRAFPFIPTHAFTDDLVERLRTFDIATYHTDDGVAAAWKNVPPAYWDQKVVEYLIKKGWLVDWNKVPEHLRTEVNLNRFLTHENADARSLDNHDLTPSQVAIGLRNRFDRSSEFHPRHVTDESIIEVLKSNLGPQKAMEFFDRIPEDKLTPAVIEAAVEDGLCPIHLIPKPLQTIDNLVKRAVNIYTFPTTSRYEELDPLSEDIADEVVGRVIHKNPAVIDNMMTEQFREPHLYWFVKTNLPVRNAWGEDRKRLIDKDKLERKRRIERFDKSLWSPRVVAEMLNKGDLPKDIDAIPNPDLINEEAAETLAVAKPEQWKSLPKRLRNREVFSRAVARNARLFQYAETHLQTEEIVFREVRRYAEHEDSRTSGYTHHYRPQPKLPRDAWTPRIWNAAVGHLCKLTDVPMDMRTHELIAHAILRDPRTSIKALKDPVAWLNEHKKLLARRIDQKSFTEELEAEGIFKAKGKVFWSIDSLPRTKLKSGGEVAVAPAGSDKRIYVYDDDGKMAFHFYTEGGKLKFHNHGGTPDHPWRAQVKEILDRHLTDIDPHAANRLGIYRHKEKGVVDEHELDRQPILDGSEIEFTVVKHHDTNAMMFWKGKDKIAQFGQGQSGYGDSFEGYGAVVYDTKACFEHRHELAKFFTQTLRGKSWLGDFNHKVGIYQKNSGSGYNTRFDSAIVLADEQIGKTKSGSVWIDERKERVSVFDKDNKLVEWAKFKKDGSISDSYNGWQHDMSETQKKMRELFHGPVAALVKKWLAKRAKEAGKAQKAKAR